MTNVPQPTSQEGSPDDDLKDARLVLERTMRFLERCARDPQEAMGSDDPRELIRGLEELAVEPSADTARPPIQIRRRRSA